MSHLHDKVSALVDGELTPQARARALAHARRCCRCRQEIQETLAVKRRVNALAYAETSLDVLDVVRPGTSTYPATPRHRPALLRKAVVSVGSMSALVLALAYAIGAPEAPQAAPVNPPVEEFTAEFADSTGSAPLADPAADGMSETTTPVSYATYRRVHGPAEQAPEPSSSASSSSTDDPAAVATLHRAVEAPARTAFVGMRVVRSMTPTGVDVFAVEVRHAPGEGTEFDVHGSHGRTLARSFVPETSAAAERLDGTLIGPLLAAYDVTMDGTQRIDGRPTSVISASRGDAVVARFWIDDATGLLLQRAMYVDGRLVRWSGYTSIRTRPRAFMEHLPPQLPTLRTTQLSTTAASVLNDKGWVFPASLGSGFRLLMLHQVEVVGNVVRGDYTDGLSTVWLFEQRGELAAASLPGFRRTWVHAAPRYVREGVPMSMVWQASGMVFTLVTDAPEQVAHALVGQLTAGSGSSSVGVPTRIRTGLSRLAAALP